MKASYSHYSFGLYLILFVCFFQKTLAQNISQDTTFARTYLDTGYTFFDDNKPDSALVYFEKAAGIYKGYPDKYYEFMTSQEQIALVYFRTSRGYLALPYFLKTLQLAYKYKLASPAKLAQIHQNLGIAYSYISKNDSALFHLNTALQLRLENLGAEHLMVGASYATLASVYQKLEKPFTALEYDENALSIFKKNKNDYYAFRQLSNIGTSLAELEQYDKAIERHKEALSYTQKIEIDDFDLALVFNNLGFAYSAKQNCQEALNYYQKSLKMTQNVQDQYTEAQVWQSMGACYMNLNRTDSAEITLQKALELFEPILGKKNDMVSVCYKNIGDIYFKRKNLVEALKYYQLGIIALSQNFNNPDYYTIPQSNDYFLHQSQLVELLSSKAFCFYELYKEENNTENIKEALNIYQFIDTILKSNQTKLVSNEDKLFYNQKYSSLYNNALEVCKESQVENKQLAFYFAERNKANILYANIQENQAKTFAGVPDSLIVQEKDLKVERAYYQKMLYEKTDSASQNYFQEKLFTSNRAYETLIQNLEQNYPQYYTLKYDTKNIEIKEIQQKLNPETLLVEYVLAEERVYIFAISKADFVWKSINIDSTFHQEVKKYNAYIKKFDKEKFAQASQLLYQKLITPLQEQLNGVKHLLVIPDARLAMIPFGTLSANTDIQNMDYLLKKYTIAYYPSAKLAFSPKKEKNYEGDFLGLAPIFSQEEKVGYTVEVTKRKAMMGDRKFDPLLGSEQELKDILELYRKKNKLAKGYFHSKANEGDFKEMKKNYRITHIATHSEVNIENPELSAVAFYPEDSLSQEDGILYANEVYALSVESDLLVLSSCETGKGRYAEGEGVLSLTRAFMYAGTDNIVSSLWQVPDKQTATLMRYFYQNILNNIPYKEALRQSKLSMLADEKTNFPYWWAAFVVMSAE